MGWGPRGGQGRRNQGQARRQWVLWERLDRRGAAAPRINPRREPPGQPRGRGHLSASVSSSCSCVLLHCGTSCRKWYTCSRQASAGSRGGASGGQARAAGRALVPRPAAIWRTAPELSPHPPCLQNVPSPQSRSYAAGRPRSAARPQRRPARQQRAQQAQRGAERRNIVGGRLQRRRVLERAQPMLPNCNHAPGARQSITPC